jgi:hypothetical protein
MHNKSITERPARVIHEILIRVTDTWAHRRGHTPKIKLTDGITTIASAILETPEDDQCWSKHVIYIYIYIYTSDVEEIFKLKNLKFLISK